jgi:phosphoenolpyruvate carboxykinase (ATP)
VATTLDKPGNTTATTSQPAEDEGKRFVRRASDMPALGKKRLANLPPAALYEHALSNDEGLLAADGPLVVRTGKHTGRSPKDKFIVDEADAHEGVWWGGFNTPITQEKYNALRQRFIDHMNAREVFVQDAFVGADPTYRRSVRAYTETAWASIFVDNLFIRPTEDELKDFVPNVRVIL